MPKTTTTRKPSRNKVEKPQPAENQQIFTTEEAMVYLRVSRSTLYRMVQAGDLKYYKLPRGGKRFRKEDLDKLMVPGKPEEVEKEDEG
jgi:excisionase family DNA binding protein